MPCLICKADHSGPCPRQQRPPRSKELQKLLGWIPQTPSEIELKSVLMHSPQMAPNLQEFLLKVFRDPTLMEGDHETDPGPTTGGSFRDRLNRFPPRAVRIYNLYASGDQGNGSDPAMETAKLFFRAVWFMHTRYPLIKNSHLQYTRVSLKRMAEACGPPEFKPARKYLTDFLYFPVGGAAVYRLYLNVKFGSIPNILVTILKYIQESVNHGVVSFKAAGPFAAPSRADSIVVYCKSETAAETLGLHLLKLESSFNAETPGMTTRLHPRLGVALGAEPERQATGMQINPEGYPEDAQSFGSIRCQLIAMAIINYNESKEVCGEGFLVFSRFVCAAFRSHGLDPMKPGA